MSKLRLMGCCGCNDCAPQCRTRSGMATLCGFDEFVDPSTPPRKFRRKTLTGKISVCEFVEPGCQECAAEGPEDYNVSGRGGRDAFGTWHNYVWSAQLRAIRYNRASGTWTYRCEAVSVVDPDDPPGQQEKPAWVVFAGLVLATGEAGEVACCVETFGAIRFYDSYLFDMLGSDRAARTPPAVTGGWRDEWDNEEQHSAATCARTADNSSSRYVLAEGGCSASNAGSAAGGTLLLAVAETYGADVVLVSETSTERVWQGIGCRDHESGSLSTTGELTEALSDEDTPADAIARATVAQPPWSLVQCGTEEATAFISPWGDTGTFGWREMQTRVAVGSLAKPAIVGHTYEVKVNLYRRPLGESGEFLFFAQLQASVTADVAPIDWSDWLDVPNEEGWETRVGSCAAIDVTFGAS